MSDPDLDQAAAYSQLISDICRLSNGTRDPREMEAAVFRLLGYDVRQRGQKWEMQKPGEDHWLRVPQILHDFGTAVRYTIGHRFGTLDHPLEQNWYVASMAETTEPLDDGRIAAWAVRLAKATGVGREKSKGAIAVSPACALVAAYLRTLV